MELLNVRLIVNASLSRLFESQKETVETFVKFCCLQSLGNTFNLIFLKKFKLISGL